MSNKMHIKTGDTVILLTGSDKYKKTKNGDLVTGKVLEVSPKEGKVIVEGFNTVTKHVKPRKQGEEGGIIKVDSPIYASKVQLYCSNCKKGVRSKHVISYKEEDGKKKRISTRVCAKCGKEI